MLGCKSRAGRRMGGRLFGGAVLAGVVMGAAAAPAAAQMTYFDAGLWEPTALSGDGRTVGMQFVWGFGFAGVMSYRLDGVWEALYSERSDHWSIVGVSGDGSTYLISTLGSARRWTSATGEVSVPPGGSTGAYDLSEDGRHALIGRNGVVMRWTGDVVLPIVAGSDGRISDDGRAAVIETADGLVRWREGLGVDALPVPAGASWVRALAMSGDGRVVYGTSNPEGDLGYSVVRWTMGGGGAMSVAVIAGPYPNDGPRPPAVAGTTADGSVVALNLIVPEQGDQNPSVWSVSGGLQPVGEYMSERGVQPSEFSIITLCGISRDGRRLAGLGWDEAAGFYGGWHATLPAVSETAGKGGVVGQRTRRP